MKSRWVWYAIIFVIVVIGLCISLSTAHAEAVIPELSAKPLSEDGRAFVAGTPPKGRALVFNAGTRWKDPTAIPHCWVNPEEGGEIVQDIERWVAKEYARAGIGFQFKGRCYGQDFNRVMIRTWFKRSHRWLVTGQIYGGGGLSWLGALADSLGGAEGEQATMNIETASDVQGYAPNSWKQWTMDVTRATAVHEFGHALGLAHEQDRRDAPICQDIRGNVPNGGEYVFVGQYDRFSIMNYCVDPSNTASLSPGDIEGLYYLYPKLRPQAVVTTPPTPTVETSKQPEGSYTIRVKSSGKCLEPSGSDLTPRACSKDLPQAFFAESSGAGYFWLKSAKTGQCIDVTGASKVNGTKAKLYACSPIDSQRFQFVEKPEGYLGLKARHSGKCLELSGENTLQQWTCLKNREESQVFGFFPVKTSRAKTVGTDAVLPGM